MNEYSFRMKELLTLYFIFMCSVSVHSQKHVIDSLNNLLKTEKDSAKIFIIIDELAWTYSNKNADKAIEYGELSLSYAKQLKNKKNIAYCYNSLGTFYLNKPNFDKAMFSYQESLKLLEELNDYANISKTHNNIGNIYQKIQLDEKALKEYKLALEFRNKSGSGQSPLRIYMNLGAIYYKMKNYKDSKFYYEGALKVVDTVKDIKALPLLYSNLGVIERHQNNYAGAMQYYLNAERISYKIKFVNPDLYSNIAALYEHEGKYEKANEYLQKASEILYERREMDKIENFYANLAINYTYLNKGDSAREYFSKYIKLRDSLYKGQSLKAINEISAKYETEKKEHQIEMITKDRALQDLKIKDQSLQLVAEKIEKEKKNQEITLLNQEKSLKELQIQKEQIRVEKNKREIELLNSQKKLSEETIDQQKTISYFTVTGLILASGLAFFIFKGLRVQRKANKLISEQKSMVEQQKLLVDEKQKEILDSIHYAKRIQNTLLAHQDFLNENIPNNFIYFNPKDIVSGDFYWATKHGNNFYIAVCDSTGHGVPGAFMSLLNIGFLSEAINEKNITETNLIFEYVRERLISSVSKEGQKDGFDGIIVRFNQSINEITYTAAHNAPILISNNELIELQKDKMPVGIGERKEKFTCHKLQVKQGDVLYLYTDGYADQFGGPKGKKFKYKPLNELLLSISNNSLEKQKQELENNFKNWKGDLEQVDDVCVIGIRI